MIRNERYQNTIAMVRAALSHIEKHGTIVESAGKIGVQLNADDYPAAQRRTWLHNLAEGIRSCEECRLGVWRKERLAKPIPYWMEKRNIRPGQAVPGEGRINVPLFALGDRPGREEDETGRPMIGRAANVFEQVISYLGLDRDRDVFITNAVKCLPPAVREPTKTEWCRCASLWLHRQILMVKPAVILVFGSVAFDALMQTKSMPHAEPKDCRSEITSEKTFDERYGNRLLDYPLDPRIKVWWARHYAALAHDGRMRVRYTDFLEPLKEAIRQFRERS